MNPAVETRVADRLAARDLAAAATEALRAYGPEILGYLRATLSDRDAEDAFSVFCEHFWKGLPGFRAEASILTWSYQVACNAARKLLAEPHRRRLRHLSSDAMDAVAQEVRSTTAVHLRKETSAKLVRVRNHLDFEEQTLLVLRVDRGLAWSEIGRITSVDDAVLRKRYERLKAKLRKLLDDPGV